MAGILVGNSSNNEAVGSLGFKGERGYSAYEIAVQHGYIGTEDEWLASKNEKWQDEGGVEVKFFKGDTDDIEDRAIIHGQLLYNTDSGETFLDYETNRINTGSGNVVAISDTEPTNDATKLWVNPNEQLNNVGTEVVNSMSGNETNMAPSVSAIKDYVEDVYSTSETLTNKVWIDNKPIYRKVVEIGEFTEGAGSTFQLGTTNINSLVDIGGSFCRKGDAYATKKYSIDNTFMAEWTIDTINNSVTLATNNQYVTLYGYLIIEYTKTTD